MTEIKLSYGKTMVDLPVEEEYLQGILESEAARYQTELTQEAIVQQALEAPIGSPQLRELARGKNKVVIITSDHTRPVPSKITLPLLLKEIRKGNPEAEIEILIATGFHRPTTPEEMEDKFGKDVVEKETFIIHRSRQKEDMEEIGALPSGGKLILNKRILNCDLLVAEGFIEPHFFAGFSGGRKAVLPGVAYARTVMENHCSKFIDSPYARTGILEGNPIHKDMVYAAEKVNLAFVLNVAIDGEKKVIHAVAGHREKAHEAGCAFVRKLASVKKKPADIVVTTNGGYPLDQDIYQTVKSLTAAEASAKEGAVLIDISECSCGHGGETFYRTFKEAESPQEVMDTILATPMEETVPDQWESQILARILIKHKVILVSDPKNKEMIEDMFMIYAETPEEALKIARSIKGEEASVTVIPDGVSVIVE